MQGMILDMYGNASAFVLRKFFYESSNDFTEYRYPPASGGIFPAPLASTKWKGAGKKGLEMKVLPVLPASPAGCRTTKKSVKQFICFTD